MVNVRYSGLADRSPRSLVSQGQSDRYTPMSEARQLEDVQEPRSSATKKGRIAFAALHSLPLTALIYFLPLTMADLGDIAEEL